MFGLMVLVIACLLMGYLSVLLLQLRRLGRRRRIMQCRMSGLNGATFKRRPSRKE